MKIASSTVAMTSNHQASSFSYKESVTVEASAAQDKVGAILTLSREAGGASYTDSMQMLEKREKEEAAQRKKQGEAKSLQDMLKRMRTEKSNQYEGNDELDLNIKMIRRILAALRGEEIPEDCKIKPEKSNVCDFRSARYRSMEEFSINSEKSLSVGVSLSGSMTSGSGTVWQKITATSGFNVEFEGSTFASTGVVKTQDGRSIDFNIEVSMSRAFMSKVDILESHEYIKTDPLVINLDGNVGKVTDQKFLFDLDSDGQEEKISFAGEGSGFLALDKNGDGKINNGSELFGTKSGDGFKDLAQYDMDGNGWIDENDDIFSKLKIWTKDAGGKDYLIDLKKADVGAIYLGNVDTQFSLKNDDNLLNGEIKKTGIFLKESSGVVGTINHIDLAV